MSVKSTACDLDCQDSPVRPVRFHNKGPDHLRQELQLCQGPRCWQDSVRATGSKPANTNSYAPSGYNCPTTAPIKGNESSMIYHPPSSPWYDATTPEQCFASEAGAVAAGFVRASY